MGYIFGLISPDLTLEAELHNRPLLGSNTLGIEMTVWPYAKECGLGNIDPQHHEGGGSSAIEEALTWKLPPDGAKLVTLRIDLDAIGAMAVLKARLEGRADSVVRELVALISVVDQEGFATARMNNPELFANQSNIDDLSLMHVIVYKFVRELSLSQKVLLVSDMLTGRMSEEIKQHLRHHVSSDKLETDFTKWTEVYDDRIAYITAPGYYQVARSWGGQRYPVTIVHDPLLNRYSIVKQDACRINMFALGRTINAKYEAPARGLSYDELIKQGFDWGGQKSTLSSPRGIGRETRIPNIKTVLLNEVYNTLEAHGSST